MLLLEVSGLFCTLRHRSIAGVAWRKKPVLKGVSFSIEEGKSLALLGESGSGKTTLAHCLVGLKQPDAGTITFNGTNLYPQIENRKGIGTKMQLLFQGGSACLDPSMTVLDSLVEAMNALAGKQQSSMHAEAERIVASVGMSGECLGRQPRQLSGGQRQRIALARVLAVAPRLLVLDEPTSALDALTSAQVLQLLKQYQAEHQCSILYITHDVRTAFSFCDRISVLHDGMIVEEGSSREVREQPKHAYTARLLRDSRVDGAGPRQ